MIKKSRIIGFRVTKEMYSLIEEESKAFNMPVSFWLRGLVMEKLKRENKPDLSNIRPNRNL